MSSALLPSLDSLAAWRRALGRGVEHFGAMLTDNGLLDAQAQTLLACVRQQLASERWVLAFVAEFSRGKSELINAMFFADTGRRLLPATPGRTTMCPVELAWDAQQMPSLALLPIASRTSGQTLAELRDQPALWVRMPLSLDDPDAMALTLEQVARAVHVPVDQARALGFWSDDQAEHNQPCDASGQVELPAWRHALINYPHPLLKRGLVVIDTPGLNAIGAEPELTLALLPSAHATVFLLAADTGVTRSDLSVWRDHLDGRVGERFVVLNKDAANVSCNVELGVSRYACAPTAMCSPRPSRSNAASRFSKHAARSSTPQPSSMLRQALANFLKGASLHRASRIVASLRCEKRLEPRWR